MTFVLFSLGVAAAFFVGSLVLLNLGRQLGLRYLRQEGGSLAGLTTVEGAVFALIGLLLAFTISGGLQRFDDRRQLVVQEANAATVASDRIGLFEGDVARNLQSKLQEYVRARIELYHMPHDFSLLRQTELFSTEQEDKIIELKKTLWDAVAAACPQNNYKPACSLTLPALNNLFEVARLRAGASEKHPPQVIYAMLFGLGLGGSLLAGFDHRLAENSLKAVGAAAQATSVRHIDVHSYSGGGCQPRFFMFIPDRFRVNLRFKFTPRTSRTTPFGFPSCAILAYPTVASLASAAV